MGTRTSQFYSRCFEVGRKQTNPRSSRLSALFYFHLKIAQKVVSNDFFDQNLFPAEWPDGYRPTKCQSTAVNLDKVIRFSKIGCWFLHATSDRPKMSKGLRLRIFYQYSKVNSPETLGLNGFSIVAKIRFFFVESKPSSFQTLLLLRDSYRLNKEKRFITVDHNRISDFRFETDLFFSSWSQSTNYNFEERSRKRNSWPWVEH